MASVGLAVLNSQLARQLEEAQRLIRPPIAATESRSLTPVAETTRRVEDESLAEIDHDGAALALYLVTAEFDVMPISEDVSYRAILRHPETGVEWTVSELRPDAMGGFSVILDRARLPHGDFRLQLLRGAGAEQEPVANYHFHLTAAETVDRR